MVLDSAPDRLELVRLSPLAQVAQLPLGMSARQVVYAEPVDRGLLVPRISLYAAKTVDGGQTSFINPTLSKQSAVIRRASSAQSTYRKAAPAAILGARGEDPQVARWSGFTLLGAATVVAGAVIRRSSGAAYPGVLTWGLAGIAARSTKQRRVVPAAAAGLAGAALLAVSRRVR